jgi:shikimate dehydrogenase
LHENFPQLELAVNWWEPFCRAHIVVNATAIGMTPREAESPLPENQALPPGAVVLDLVYNPPETKFLREAARDGARGIGGLEMLVYQGALAFTLWTRREAPLKVMHAAAKRALDAQQAATRRDVKISDGG